MGGSQPSVSFLLVTSLLLSWGIRWFYLYFNNTFSFSFIYVYECFAWMHVCSTLEHIMPDKNKGGHCIFLNRRCGWLLTKVWVLWIKPDASGRVASALSRGAISLALLTHGFKGWCSSCLCSLAVAFKQILLQKKDLLCGFLLSSKALSLFSNCWEITEDFLFILCHFRHVYN